MCCNGCSYTSIRNTSTLRSAAIGLLPDGAAQFCVSHRRERHGQCHDAGLTIRLKVVQFDSGSQFQRWFFGGLGNQGEASLHLLAEFYEGDKKPADIQTEGWIGSGAFGGSMNSAVDKAAVANFR